MSNAAIRMEQLILPTYPEPGKEEMPLFSEHRVHQRSTGRPYPNKVTLEVNRTQLHRCPSGKRVSGRAGSSGDRRPDFCRTG